MMVVPLAHFYHYHSQVFFSVILSEQSESKDLGE